MASQISMSKVSINLLLWNGEKYLPFCLESLKKQSFSDWELNILNNGSTDNSLKYLKEHYPQFRVNSLKQNIGFARGHNKLISWTNSEYILCLNQDTILEPNFLKNAVRFLDKNKNIGAISPKIYKWDFKKLDIETPPEPEIAEKISEIGKTTIIDSCGLKIFKNHQVVDWGQGEEDSKKFSSAKSIFGVSGALPIYRRKTLEKIKINNEYFDEDFFSYKEDVDLSYRIQLAGYKIYFLPQVIGYHDRSISKDKSIIKDRKIKTNWIKQHSYKNHLWCIVKNEFSKNLFKYFLPIFWYELKKFLYILILENKTLKFFLKNKKEYKKIIKKRKYIYQNMVKIKAEQLAKWYDK